MKRRWALRFLLFVCGASTAFTLVMQTEWAGERLCERGASLLSRLLGEPVLLSSCSIRPLSGEVHIEGIQLGGGGQVFVAHRLSLRLTLLAGRGGGIASVELVEPEIDWRLEAAEEQGEKEGESPSSGGGDCLAFLQRLPIEDLDIQKAKVRLHLPDGSQLRAAGVDLAVQQVQRRHRLRLALREGSFRQGSGLPIPINRIAAEVELDPTENYLDIDALEAEALGVRLEVRGGVRQLCDPHLALRGTVTADLGTLAGQLAPDLGLQGRLFVSASVAGSPSDPRGDALVVGNGIEMGELEPDHFTATLAYAQRNLVVEELRWPVGDGQALVQGEVGFFDRWPARVSVRTEALEFHRLLAKLPVKNTPVMMRIDSEHHLSGNLLDGMLLEGSSSLTIRSFQVRNVPWHREGGTVLVEVPGVAHLDGKVRLDEREIVLSPAVARFGAGGTRLELGARLAFEEARGMRIDVNATHFDLADVAGHVAEVPLGGVGTIQALIDGPYEDPLIEGRIEFDDAKLFAAELGNIRSPARSLPGRGELDFLDLVGERNGTFYDAEASLVFGDELLLDGKIAVRSGGRIEEVFGATRHLASPLAWLRENLQGRVRGASAVVRGALPNIEAEGSLELDGVRFLDRPFDSLQANLRVPDISRLVVDDVRLERGEGWGRAVGEVRFEGREGPEVDARVRARDLPLRDLMGSFGEWAELEGGVGAHARLHGPIERLELGGEIFGVGLGAAGVPLEDTRLSLETQGGEVIVRGVVARAGSLAAAVRLTEGLPFDASFDLDLPRLAAFFPAGSRMDGEVQGQLTASGTLADITSSAGSVRLDRLAISLGEYRVESKQEVNLDYVGAAFVLFGLDLVGPNTELSLYGNRSVDGHFDLQAYGHFDARLVGTLLPQIEHPSGIIDVKASMTGTSERPILVGSADIRRGAFRTRGLPITVQDLTSSLTFSQNQVVVEEGEMIINGGPATLRGTTSLRSFAPHQLDLLIEGQGMSWRMPAEWPAVVSGRVGIGGEFPDAVRVTGELTVDRLRYAKDLDLERTILDFSRRVAQRATPDENEWVRFDIDLIGGPDMRVDNNMVRARVQFVGGEVGRGGRLRLVGTNQRIGLLGSAEVLEGVAFFRGNEYRVLNGMIDFKERDRIDPFFDITAETHVRDYRVVAHAYGRLGDGSVGNSFQLELRSEPMLAQADIVTLLTFGITSRDLDLGGSTAAAGAGMAAEALLTVSGFDEHVRRWLPQTPLLMDPDISLTTQFSELTGQMEPMAVFEAKILTDRLRLKTATPVATSKGRRAAAEFQVSDRLSSQIIWQNEAVGYSSGDLGIDLKLRWEWE